MLSWHRPTCRVRSASVTYHRAIPPFFWESALNHCRRSSVFAHWTALSGNPSASVFVSSSVSEIHGVTCRRRVEPVFTSLQHAAFQFLNLGYLCPNFELKFIRFLSFQSSISLKGSGRRTSQPQGVSCKGGSPSSHGFFPQHKPHAEVSLFAHPTDMAQEEFRRFEMDEIDGFLLQPCSLEVFESPSHLCQLLLLIILHI